jgi:FKBP-type peptidyl-prolyl cis-trans isomerase SlyD
VLAFAHNLCSILAAIPAPAYRFEHRIQVDSNGGASLEIFIEADTSRIIKGIASMTMIRSAHFYSVSIAAFLSLLALNTAYAQEKNIVIANGNEVSFFYTLSSDGEQIETNKGGEPLTYTQGAGQILPKLEAELEGLKSGDVTEVSLVAADAYGEVDPAAFQEVPIDQIPEQARVVGTQLEAQNYPGPIEVSEVREDIIVLDLNHPMAGMDLVFDIEIVEVK